MVKFYPDPGWQRTRRIVADLLVLGWSAVWIYAGVEIYRLVISLQGLADGITGTGQRIDGIISAFRQSVPGDVPIVSSFLNQLGTALERSSGGPLIALGTAAHGDVARLALVMALTVSAPALILVSGRYLVRRWRDTRELGAARAFVDAAVTGGAVPAVTALLAYRAVATLSFTQLMRVSRDPVADLLNGRHDRLAAAQLAHLGLSPKRGRP